MDPIILKDISLSINKEQFLKKIHVNDKPNYSDQAQRLLAEAQSIARPKAMYKEAFIEAKGEDFVVIDGITLTSRVLRINLEDTFKVFPYIATAGVELEDWSNSIDDMLEQYWADTIKEMILRFAIEAFRHHLQENYYQGRTSAMNPGSLQEWPISQQKNLFAILGNPKKLIGVELKESYLMSPIKSVSGIRFPTEVNFENCQLCPKEKCPGRKARYNKELYESKFA